MNLRAATMDDARLLFEWRNDGDTRANSRDHGVLTWDGHVEWLEAALADPARELLVAEIDGVAVGTVRRDRDADGAVLSWTVAPARRGEGIGRAMVGRAVDLWSGAPLRAEINVANGRSIAIARALGFRLCTTTGAIAVWRRP